MPDTIIAAYDDLVVAEQVIQDLVNIGCRPEDVGLLGVGDADCYDSHSGFPEVVHTGVSRVSVSGPGSLVEQVMEVIHRHNPQSIEGPNFQWRRSGTWPSYPF